MTLTIQADNKVPGITVKMLGGLGNQLFILAAGLEQARRLGCPLYLDISDYNQINDRKFELSSLDLPNVFIKDVETTNNRFISTKITNKILRQNVYHSNSDKFDPEIFKVKPGATLIGYFQLPEYSQNAAKEIAIQLADGLPQNSINVHVRRGDYTQVRNSESYGLLTNEYFLKAIEIAKSQIQTEVIQFFSDSPNEIVDLVTKAGGLLKKPSESSTALESLISLSKCQSLILSNSSFSWWAARIACEREIETCIISPKPWFKGASISAGNIALKSWIELPANFTRDFSNLYEQIQ